MADIASSKSKMNDTEINADAPLSEALHEKIGANINYLIDTTDNQETRLDNLETEAANGTGFISGNVTTTGNVATAVRPASPGTKVMILAWGTVTAIAPTGSATATIQFRRDSTVIYSEAISASSNPTIDLRTFLDIAATNNTSHTYSVHCSAISLSGLGQVTYNFNFGVIDVK